MSQSNFAAFQLTHLQNIIDERKQMIGRHPHFIPVGIHQLRILRVRRINF